MVKKEYRRDPKVSLKIIHTLNEVMAKRPHLRVGQLIEEAIYAGEGTFSTYYAEDDSLLAGLQKLTDLEYEI